MKESNIISLYLNLMNDDVRERKTKKRKGKRKREYVDGKRKEFLKDKNDDRIIEFFSLIPSLYS